MNAVFGEENVLVTGLSSSAKATIIAEKFIHSPKQMLVITNNLYQADKLESDLLQYIDADDIYKYPMQDIDRKSTRLNSSHVSISYAVFCLKKKNTNQ